MTYREIIELVCFVVVAAVLAYAGGCVKNHIFGERKGSEAVESAGVVGENGRLGETADDMGEAGDGSALRAMSFNVRYGTADDGENSWRFRRELVFDTIRRYRPDVVGLQEALRFQIDEIREALPDYAEVGVGREDGDSKGEYSAILFDTRRFEAGESSTFWLSDTPEVAGSNTWAAACTRICTWVRLIERETGRDVWVFNTHFDHISARARGRSARLIARKIEELAGDDEFILMGDLNAGETSREVNYLKSLVDFDGQMSPLKMVDTFRLIHPDAEQVGTFGGFRGAVEGEKIDYVLVSADTKVLDAEIMRYNEAGRYPSDHYPVTATVVFQ